MERTNYVAYAVLKEALRQFTDDYAILMDHRTSEQYHLYLLPPDVLSMSGPIMQEIGFQRKRAFSNKGAGGHEELDIDAFDKRYFQLILTRIEEEMCEIIGGYRGYLHKAPDTFSQLDMGRLFKMTNLCCKVPAFELGRSWIKDEYQADKIAFPLLVCGLGMIRTIVFHESRPADQRAKFWFGKVTNPANIQHLLLEFLDVKHPDRENLMSPKDPFLYIKDVEYDMEKTSYGKAYRDVRKYMPEIWPIYLRIAPREFIYTCGTAKNDQFGDGISETGLAIPIGREEPQMTKMFVAPVEDLVLKKTKMMNML